MRKTSQVFWCSFRLALVLGSLSVAGCKRSGAARTETPTLPLGAVAITWNDNALSFAGREFGVPRVVYCPPNGTPGPVFGAELYAANSSICTAAVHMRRITLARGGLVTMYSWPQARVFTASTREGIRSATSLQTQWTFNFEPRIPRHRWPIMEDTLDFTSRSSPPETFLPDAPMLPPPVPVEPPVAVSWRDVATRWRSMIGTAHTIVCPPLTAAPGRTVWGSEIYTHDSHMCVAALHAGVITSAGGQATLYMEPGLDRYQASERNGVSTRSYGRWNGSFTFRPPQRRGPIVVPTTPVPASWTATAKQLQGMIGAEVTVVCPPGDFPEPIFGGGSGTPFSQDSSLCTAGVFAGAITFATGGPVRIRIGPGSDLYDTEDRNGVWTGRRSLNLPGWTSFTVVR